MGGVNKNQLSWWDYDEQQVAGHERAVQLLGSLAQSFGVEVSDDDKLRWSTMLGVFRCLDDAIDTAEDLNSFDPDTFEHRLKNGRGINGKLSTPVALGFRKLYHATPPLVFNKGMTGHRRVAEQLLHDEASVPDYEQPVFDADSGKERRELRNIVIRLLSFARDALKTHKVREYETVLEREARYKGGLLQIRRSNEQELAEPEIAFNKWLVDFYVAYSSIDAVIDLRQDHKNGETKVEPTAWSYAHMAVVSLKATRKVFRAATPEARKHLVRASASRGLEKFSFPRIG